jgi:hypothetical protein
MLPAGSQTHIVSFHAILPCSCFLLGYLTTTPVRFRFTTLQIPNEPTACCPNAYITAEEYLLKFTKMVMGQLVGTFKC